MDIPLITSLTLFEDSEILAYRDSSASSVVESSSTSSESEPDDTPVSSSSKESKSSSNSRRFLPIRFSSVWTTMIIVIITVRSDNNNVFGVNQVISSYGGYSRQQLQIQTRRFEPNLCLSFFKVFCQNKKIKICTYFCNFFSAKMQLPPTTTHEVA